MNQVLETRPQNKNKNKQKIRWNIKDKNETSIVDSRYYLKPRTIVLLVVNIPTFYGEVLDILTKDLLINNYSNISPATVNHHLKPKRWPERHHQNFSCRERCRFLPFERCASSKSNEGEPKAIDSKKEPMVSPCLNIYSAAKTTGGSVE